MRILGVDPGSRITGFGIIDFVGNQQKFVSCGCIKIKLTNWGDRLLQIFQDLTEVITEYKPEHLAIEQVFVHKNVQGALKLGQARGAAIVASANSGLTVDEYSPREIKQAVVGYGAADKAQVQHMTQVILNLSKLPAADAADALAVAICHANRVGVKVYDR